MKTLHFSPLFAFTRQTFVALLLLVAVPVLASPADDAAAKGKPATTAMVKPLQTAEPKFNFQGVTVSQVVSLIYEEVLKKPYVLDPRVLADQRPVSLRFDGTKGELPGFLRDFLHFLGLRIESRAGVDFVTSDVADLRMPDVEPPPELEVYVYRPKFRELAYLTELLSPLFKTGSFTVSRAVRSGAAESATMAAPASSAAAQIDQHSDVMVFQGTATEIALLTRVLPQIDTPAGEVLVQGVVYEVTTGRNESSGFQLALSLLGGKLGVKVSTPSSGNSTITLKAAVIDAAIDALASDSRFKVVSTPYLRVKSGQAASLTVGQDVPVLGSVSYPQGGGTPVRSVDYKSAGVIFNISPRVRDSVIDVDVSQQVSNFVKTETGVDDSPTLIKRELKTNVSAKDGELIVLGGLRDEKDNASRSGLSFLPDFLRARSSSSNQTEILLMLQLTKTGS